VCHLEDKEKCMQQCIQSSLGAENQGYNKDASIRISTAEDHGNKLKWHQLFAPSSCTTLPTNKVVLGHVMGTMILIVTSALVLNSMIMSLGNDRPMIMRTARNSA
jgi:hypothetical protein